MRARLLLPLVLLAAEALAQPVFVVTSTADTDDGTCDALECTLREAIEAARDAQGGIVVFNGLTSGNATIVVDEVLPPLNHSITLDGTTHPDGRVGLNGSALTEGGGLAISAPNCLVRGLAVYGFPGDGIAVAGSETEGTRIEDTFVGTDVSGTVARGNRHGIAFYVASSVTISGGNVISGNEQDGIRISGSHALTIAGNRIGTAADGVTPLGNGGYGVSIFSSASLASTVLGGTAPGAGNTIAFNASGGVRLNGSPDPVYAHRILGNAIFENGGSAGIDLDTDGVTANDPGDGDYGPNYLQNFPAFQAATIGADGGLYVEYAVDSAPAHAAYPITVEFFVADAAGTGGLYFLARDSYTLADHGGGAVPGVKHVVLGDAAALGVAPDERLIATATDAGGNTSEFSAATALGAPTAGGPEAAPTGFALQPVYPNPLDRQARLRYDLAAAGPVRLTVYDALGRVVGVLADGPRAAGRHEVAFEAADLPSGIYIVRLEAGGRGEARRMAVVR